MLFFLNAISAYSDQRLTLQEVIVTCRQNLMDLLCFMLGSTNDIKRKNAEKTITHTLRAIQQQTSGRPPSTVASNSIDVAIELRAYVLGTLHDFTNAKLMSEDATDDMKLQMLRALRSLVRIMGSEIGVVASQVERERESGD